MQKIVNINEHTKYRVYTRDTEQIKRKQLRELDDLPIETMLNYLIDASHVDDFIAALATATDGEIEVPYDINAIKPKRIIAYLINVFCAKVLRDKLIQLLHERDFEAWEAFNRGQGI